MSTDQKLLPPATNNLGRYYPHEHRYKGIRIWRSYGSYCWEFDGQIHSRPDWGFVQIAIDTQLNP